MTLNGHEMNTAKILMTILVILTLSGCAAITITASGQSDFRYRPNFEQSQHFYLWGLVGEHTVNTRAVCKDTPVSQMQTKFSAMDVLYATLTLGIYLPRTARVWCEREEEVE
jgi:uncharacterized protein YceK